VAAGGTGGERSVIPWLDHRSALLVSIGASAYVGLLHGRLSRSGERASRWVGTWAGLSVAFACARLTQLEAREAGAAIWAARAYAACSPLLIWSLWRLVLEIAQQRPSRSERRLGDTVAFGCAALMLGTPWFVLPRIVPSVDLFGRPYLGVHGGPAMPLVGLALIVALVWCQRVLSRQGELARAERRLLFGTLAVYAGMGASTLASSLGWIPWAGLAEYGPLVVAIGASQLVSIRQRRLEQGLAAEVAARTRALRESESRYRSFFVNAPVGILSVDASGQLLDVNPNLLATIGSDAGSSPGDVIGDERSTSSGFADHLRRCLTTGETAGAEYEFESAGRAVTTRAVVSPRRDAAGRIVGALALVRDVTAQRQSERRLRQTEKMEAVGQLSAGIAHEINNPMAYVRANLGVLREEALSLRKEAQARGDTARERLGAIDAAIGRCLASVDRTVAIVRDLREFARSAHSEREPTDLRALLEQATRLALLQRRGDVGVDERLAELPSLWASPSQLRQAFLNLIAHALARTPDGGRIELASAVRAGRVEIGIRDAGPALPAERRLALFEPFGRAGLRDGGAGLALYIAQQIVRSHGGEVTVSGDAGCEVRVALPLEGERRPGRAG
jgi:PAS domain S-box-containing protein